MNILRSSKSAQSNVGVENLQRERVFSLLNRNTKTIQIGVEGEDAERKAFGFDMKNMIQNQHEIISVFGKLPLPYYWSFMNACGVVGKKEHGVRQGMYRDMIGALGWEKLHYA
jgi:hypothetical protein